nr:MAG TPA: hypothetical protein [Caudoviricetes sp.]DAX68186.1 MAG TPA: hypothetical protein [Crassvirales sp.]
MGNWYLGIASITLTCTLNHLHLIELFNFSGAGQLLPRFI